MIASAAEMMCDQFNSGLLKLAAVSPDSASVSISIFENLAVSCSVNIKSNTVVESTARSFCPTSIRSGGHTDIGPRRSNEDQHIMIDDLSKHLVMLTTSYVKEHAMRLFFEDSDLPQAAPTGASDADDLFLKQVEESHNRAFLQADLALADECSVSDYCGTTALTVLIVGRHIIIANAGDSRAVLCRNGSATQMTQDHRGSTCLQEKERCERLGGYFDEDGYLNGQLSVTREALAHEEG
ncbi:putative protein-serine/threonine phosphatase [Helianthus anomalus]